MQRLSALSGRYIAVALASVSVCEAGFLAMIVRPLRDAEIVAGHRIAHRARGGARRAAIAEMLGILDLAVGIGQQHGRFAVDAREHVAHEESAQARRCVRRRASSRLSA